MGMGVGGILLGVDGLTRTFPLREGLLSLQRRSVTVLDDVGFTLSRGETLGLIGGSGSGKSTLARLLVGLDTPTRGRIAFDGTAIDPRSDAAMRPVRRRLQMVAQDAASALNPRKPVGRQIAAPLLRFGLAATRTEAADAAAALLEQVGLRADDARRLPHQFSGGQRQRINIARALGVRADLLILDEPTSALDVTVQAQILALLAELKRVHDLSYLFISHNLAVVSSFCDRVLVLDRGRLVDDFPASGFGDPRRAPATKRLLDAIQGPTISLPKI